jgi:NAD(P)-dependent dehydrogenase (short-subunit alcohol dehydrogenase family)
VIVVTGGASGIGSAVVAKFRSNGRAVLVLDRGSSSLVDGAVTVVEVDVTDERAVRDAVEANRNGSQIDALVCSAGVFDTDPQPSSETFKHIVNVNLVGTWNAIQACEPWFAPNSTVVTMASVSGRTRSVTAGPAYVASKAGVIGLTRAMAARWGARGVRVNCIAPGPVDTEMTTSYTDAQRVSLIEQIPLGRFGTVEEIAAVVEFLSSPASGFITGAVIDANGGMFMP